MASPCWAANCQHTAIRSQYTGTADTRAAARSPAPTSAPKRARPATRLSETLTGPSDSAAAVEKACTGWAPTRNSPTTTSNAAARSRPSRLRRRSRARRRRRAATTVAMPATANAAEGEASNPIAAADAAVASTRSRPGREDPVTWRRRRRAGGGAVRNAAASSTAPMAVIGPSARRSFGAATRCRSVGRRRYARPAPRQPDRRHHGEARRSGSAAGRRWCD